MFSATKKLKNAYLVALTNRELYEYGYPDGSCQLIHATNSTQARCIYKKQNFLDDKASSLPYKRYEEEDLYFFEGYEKSKRDIERELEYRKWYSDMVDMVKNNPMLRYIFILVNGEHIGDQIIVNILHIKIQLVYMR